MGGFDRSSRSSGSQRRAAPGGHARRPPQHALQAPWRNRTLMAPGGGGGRPKLVAMGKDMALGSTKPTPGTSGLLMMGSVTGSSTSWAGDGGGFAISHTLGAAKMKRGKAVPLSTQPGRTGLEDGREGGRGGKGI